MSNLVIATVNTFQNGNQDKNGKDPVILNVISGKSPNRNVMAGTVAENVGIEVGKAYIMQWRETEANEYGRQFRWTKVSELSGLDIVKASTELGAAEIFAVEGTKQNEKSESKMEEAPEFAEDK